jgi:hypothetical protein
MMHLGRARRWGAIAVAWVAFALARAAAAADADACAGAASVSSCFDADALWLPAGPATFVAFGSPRTLEAGELMVALGAGIAWRPVTLIAPSPHPEGRELRVVEATTTLTLGGRVGLGRGLDAGLTLPIAPYQHGTGVEGVTAQQSDGLARPVLREPRLGFGAIWLGRRAGSAFTLGTKLELALPFGNASALAGAAGPTLAPSIAAELVAGPVTFGSELGARLRRAVQFADVNVGSAAVIAAGASVELLREPTLAAGVEVSLRPRLGTRSPAAMPGARDLPAEWLAHVRFEPSPRSWSLALAGGCGLPLSRAQSPGGSEAALGVTAPRFRLLASARYRFEL